MKIDVLIIGQGICGSFLCRELDRVGLSYVVMDDERPGAASRAAAGLINPVTGRRMVKTWMIDELLPFMQNAYDGFGEKLLRSVQVVDFFPTAQMRVAFVKRVAEGADYLRLASGDHEWDHLFRYELGFGTIGPCYLVDVQQLLTVERARLIAAGRLLREVADPGKFSIVADAVRYRDMEARWAIFCDGVVAAEQGYFSRLPFAPNKGEALIIEAKGLEKVEAMVFKRGVSLVPWNDGLFWVGSSYEWSFTDPGPTAVFRERTEALLRGWLKLPFQTVDHFASVRPATLERRPFVGLHPVYARIGLLNGLGTKGCSLAPFFARQLATLLATGKPVMAEADVARFKKLLGTPMQ